MSLTKDAVSKFMEDATQKLAALEASKAEMEESLKAAMSENETLKGLISDVNLKALHEDVEKIKASNTSIKRSIQANSGLKISGAEDIEFSLIKAMMACKSGGRQFGDTQEWEFMKQAREKASQTVGVEADGGWMVPDQVIPDVIAGIYRRSVLVDLSGDGQTRVSVLDGLSGGKVRIPKFKKGVIAYWQGEMDKATLSKAQTGDISMEPKKLSALTRLTEEMIRFSLPAFETALRNDMERALSEKLDETLLYGLGTGDTPRGIVALGANSYVPGGNAAVHAELDFDGLSDMDLLMEEEDLMEDDTFATISSPAYFRRLARLRALMFSAQSESTAPYLIDGRPLTREQMVSIIGDFDKTTAIASNKNVGDGAAKATDVFRGNFGEVLLGRWSGIELVTEDSFDVVDDTRLQKLRMYADVNSRYPKAISVCRNAKARA